MDGRKTKLVFKYSSQRQILKQAWKSYVGNEATNQKTEWRNQTRWPQEESIQWPSCSLVKMVSHNAKNLTLDEWNFLAESIAYFTLFPGRVQDGKYANMYIKSHNNREYCPRRYNRGLLVTSFRIGRFSENLHDLETKVMIIATSKLTLKLCIAVHGITSWHVWDFRDSKLGNKYTGKITKWGRERHFRTRKRADSLNTTLFRLPAG